jgi:hypothetical protein
VFCLLKNRFFTRKKLPVPIPPIMITAAMNTSTIFKRDVAPYEKMLAEDVAAFLFIAAVITPPKAPMTGPIISAKGTIKNSLS